MPGNLLTIKNQLAIKVMKELLKRLNLYKIKDLEFDETLSGGKASATLVYKKSDEKYIVKILIAPRNDNELKRFKQEAEALEKIKDSLLTFHTELTIPRLITSFTQHENLPVYYFIMEKVEGKRLDEIFTLRPLPWTWKDSIIMLLRIATALKYIGLKYIHRDLHPLNIIVQEDSEYSKLDRIYLKTGIKILDFGCTKDWINYTFGLWNDDSFRIPGAISSWSPELLINPNEVDIKHDSWALGVIFYRLLTNKYPYPAENFGDIINYKENILLTFNEIELLECPLAVKLLVKKCLEIDKDERFSVSQIIDVCNDVLYSDLLGFAVSRINKYFDNGGSLYACNKCYNVDISGLQNRCPKCGVVLEDEDIANMLSFS